MRARSSLTASLAAIAAATLAGCSSTPLEGDPPSPSATESTISAAEPAGTPPPSAPSAAEIETGLDECSDALFYWYADDTFNSRFNLIDVTFAAGRYTFHNQQPDYQPGDSFPEPDVAAYVDSLVLEDDADIWCEQTGSLFTLGIEGGPGIEGATLQELMSMSLDRAQTLTEMTST